MTYSIDASPTQTATLSDHIATDSRFGANHGITFGNAQTKTKTITVAAVVVALSVVGLLAFKKRSR